MSATLSVLGALVAFGFASMLYVYRFRGATRFAGVGEYFRKGWPVFSPLNCLLYVGTKRRARRPWMDLADFPELAAIQENWEVMRDEGLALLESKRFEATKREGTDAAYDVGFRTFFKYGWGRFYVKWYGYEHASAKDLCPRTSEILSGIDAVNGAMFAVLPPHSGLTRHLDPVACSLRYHLGLATPGSNDCYINVDGQSRSWRDGEPLLFDETYLHYAKNETDQPRLILMCDVDRPMGVLGRTVNFFYKLWMRVSVVPNDERDQRGLANRIFGGVAPLLARLRALKATNRSLYVWVKWTINVALALLALGLVAAVTRTITWMISTVG